MEVDLLMVLAVAVHLLVLMQLEMVALVVGTEIVVILMVAVEALLLVETLT